MVIRMFSFLSLRKAMLNFEKQIFPSSKVLADSEKHSNKQLYCFHYPDSISMHTATSHANILRLQDILHPRPGMGIGEPIDWANTRFQLTLAAMPSSHFGTSVLTGVAVCVFGRHTWLRVLAPLYPIIMFLTVIATANHWVLDCVAGLLVVIVGWNLNWIMLGLRPIEEWGFWAVGMEKLRNELAPRRKELSED